MKPKKSKANNPSLRDRLSADYLKAFQSDFEAHGVAAIEALRAESPSKYAEIASRLIAQTEPPDPNDLSRAKTSADVARIQLQGIGLTDPSDSQIEQAMAAVSRFMTELEMIAALDVSTEMLEERELRQ